MNEIERYHIEITYVSKWWKFTWLWTSITFDMDFPQLFFVRSSFVIGDFHDFTMLFLSFFFHCCLFTFMNLISSFTHVNLSFLLYLYHCIGVSTHTHTLYLSFACWFSSRLAVYLNSIFQIQSCVCACAYNNTHWYRVLYLYLICLRV